MTPIKVNIMAIIGVSHNTHYGKNGHYGCYGSTKYGCKFDLYGCSWKICSKCRSPVKTVLQKIHPKEFYGQNKKIEKKWPFSGDFLCIFVQNFKRVVLPQKLQENSEFFFGGLLGIETALIK